METWQLIFFIVKLIFGGIASFLAIMLWSKSRNAAVISIVSAIIISYAGVVYDMMIALGVVTASSATVMGIPVLTLLFAVVPQIFFIYAFIVMLLRD